MFVKESIILAAGYSSRFNFKEKTFKKFLLPLKRSIILNYVIGGMVKAGINKINIVIDKKLDSKQVCDSCFEFLEKLDLSSDHLILNLIQNNHSERENGFSLYLGVHEITSENFVLSMADHVFSDNIYSNLNTNYNNEDILLATDPMKIKGIYDLDDCTKVLGVNLDIKNIGKNILNYNRLDMGVFIMNAYNIRKLCINLESKKKSFGVSDVVRLAIELKLKVSFLDFPNVIWLDIDDDNEYNKLKQYFNNSNKYRPFNL